MLRRFLLKHNLIQLKDDYPKPRLIKIRHTTYPDKVYTYNEIFGYKNPDKKS